jgi:hypothetical protein
VSADGHGYPKTSVAPGHTGTIMDEVCECCPQFPDRLYVQTTQWPLPLQVAVLYTSTAAFVAVTWISTTWFALSTIIVCVAIGSWAIVAAVAIAYTVTLNGMIAYLPPATQRMLLQQYVVALRLSVKLVVR